ncbi:DUF5789 family protein [Halorubrum sp. HHNYT27]|uniref:DUF5789 family protein n=1 Tax=Halorubrum sp. HHNYT27 TaxID=3402275 RepID=UPI003EBC5B26
MGRENEGHDQTTGVTFGPLKQALREHSYPVSVGELVEQYGGFELETAGGSERLDAALERCDQTQFRDPRGVRDAILDALGEEATAEGAAAGETGDEAVDDGWSRLST